VLTADDPSVPLDPLMLAPSTGAAGLSGAAADSIRWLNDRTLRMGQVLRRRPLRITESVPEASAAAVRTLRNLHGDQIVTYHFFEPLERWRVTARAARLRPAVLVPFRLPALATREVVRQFGHIFRPVLLDRSLEPDLDRMLAPTPGLPRSDTGPAAVSELRLIVQRAAGEQAPDLRHVWCFLHVDNTRYTVHFFPADAVAGVDAPTATPHWIGAIRLADFHRWPLRYPGAVSIQNGSGSMLAFDAVHLEGRVAEHWVRLHTIANLVLPPNSQVGLASLATLVASQGIDPREGRLLAHIAANIPSYSAAIIARSDPGGRYLALSKIRSATGHALAEVIENTVAGVVGSYLAFPLRTPEFAPPGLRAALEQYAARPVRVPEEAVVTLPLPGTWVSAQRAGEPSDADAASSEDRVPQRNRRTGWPR